MKTATSTARTNAIIHRHLIALHRAVPCGTHDEPQRGAATARALVLAITRAIHDRAHETEGSAAQLCRRLREDGRLALARDPSPLTAGAALALLSSLTPLVRRVGHGRYRLLFRPGEDVIQQLAALQHANDFRGDAEPGVRSGRGENRQAGSAACAVSAGPQPLSAEHGHLKERACAVNSEGDDRGGAADPRGLRAANMDRPVLAGPAPHDPRLHPPRKRVGFAEAKAWTPSAWMQALTGWKHLQRAGLLCLRHLPTEGFTGTAAALASWLAGCAGLRRRDRAALVRGLRALVARGCLEIVGETWRLPELRPHEAVVALGVDAMPSPARPSPRMAARLERAGICPAGLGRHEAMQLHRRLWSRATAGLPSPAQVARARSAVRSAGFDVDLQSLGRMHPVSLSNLIEQAHAVRVWREVVDG